MPEYSLLENTQFKLWSSYIKYGLIDKKSYDWYWKPIDEKLNGIRKLSVTSNGIYHRINLNALYHPGKEKYLIDLYELSYVSSTLDIATRAKSELTFTVNDQLLAVGDPLFDTKFEQLYDDQTKEFAESIDTMY